MCFVSEVGGQWVQYSEVQRNLEFLGVIASRSCLDSDLD